jgi:branched-subunit amino acid transport protein
MIDFAVIAAAGAITFLLRSSFISLAGDHALPRSSEAVLRYARPAVLAALAASATVGNSGATLDPALLPRIAGVAVAGFAAWRSGNMLTTLAAGFGAFTLARLLIELAA